MSRQQRSAASSWFLLAALLAPGCSERCPEITSVEVLVKLGPDSTGITSHMALAAQLAAAEGIKRGRSLAESVMFEGDRDSLVSTSATDLLKKNGDRARIAARFPQRISKDGRWARISLDLVPRFKQLPPKLEQALRAHAKPDALLVYALPLCKRKALAPWNPERAWSVANSALGGAGRLVTRLDCSAPGCASQPAALIALHKLQQRVRKLPRIRGTRSVVDLIEAIGKTMGAGPLSSTLANRQRTQQMLLLSDMSATQAAPVSEQRDQALLEVFYTARTPAEAKQTRAAVEGQAKAGTGPFKTRAAGP